jgi:proline dehydrogenase
MTDLKLDFQDTAIAFSSKSDRELKKTARLFSLMNKKWLVDIGSKVGLAAFKYKLPFASTMVEATIFDLFCGGKTLLDCQPNIDKLRDFQVNTILDYGAEGKDTEEDFNLTMNENMRGIDFAFHNPSIPAISTKITGLTHTPLLEKMHEGLTLSTEEEHQKQSLLKRVDVICNKAAERGVAVFIDAEESWMQKPIDDIVTLMMSRYNKNQPIVYNTFQMYRTDRLAFLKESYSRAKSGAYILGAKIVRGAYMDKERARAADMGYPSPIQPDKLSADADYNAAIRYCIDHHEQIAFCNASHNATSNQLMASYIHEKGLSKDHPHFMFCQLYGMSDNLTFNLAKAGFKVAKYMPYGPVRDVIPYLIRRTQENAAVTGDLSREYEMILKEVKRRGL